MMRDGMMCPMMGGGMMREGMMGRGMMGPMMSPLAMSIMFALMDADGDGTVSLQEFQTAHERIFKAMDANKDGVLSLEEIQGFMQGKGAAPPR
jgi:Ca2+-binding EF-hand superfamily protein